MSSHSHPERARGAPAAPAAPAANGAAGPAEIARRVLRTLAERRLAPTPEAFAEAYYEAAGASGAVASATDVLKEILRDLLRQNRLGGPEAVQILERAQQHDWLAVRNAVDKVLARRPGAIAGNWPAIALQLIRQVDALHGNWTRARKLEAVARVVEAASAQPEVAFERLTRLVESWGTPIGAGTGTGAAATPAVAPAAPPPADPAARARGETPAALRYPAESADPGALAQVRAELDAWRQVGTRALRLLAHSFDAGSPAHDKLLEFAAQGAAADAAGAERLVPRFTDIVATIERQVAEQHQVRAGLQRLLALLCDNMKTLAPEEAWLAGQLEPIRALLAGPIATEPLAAAEQRLAQVISRQSGAREGLHEAKNLVREMLTSLIDQTGSMGSSAGRFTERIGRFQADLERADDLPSLTGIARGLLAETQSVRADFEEARGELLATRSRAEAYEARVKDLERELVQVSSLVLQDPLTLALNRRGLEQSFRIESARASRQRVALSLVMIDLDDFKAINDQFGHVAGDQVLVQLVAGLRGSLRPTDFIARTGGEEFAVLMPAIAADGAAVIAARLLGEVAAAAMSIDGRRITVTCSAGVATWRSGEPLESLMKRADGALYEAKRDGKNRVTTAS